ncbi:MAG: photosynthetic complex putative assembly protein PuhB [Alphaproteobacteria bacterium]
MSHHHDDFEREPIPGLPEVPPEGEKILWQGSPDWKGLALRAFHARKVAIYFGILIVWELVDAATGGGAMSDALISAVGLVAMGAAASAVLVYLARISARTSIYTITNHRVVMRIGMAFPVTINLPFKLIDSASMKTQKNGLGDIPIAVREGNRVAYAVLWPHARPWHVRHPEPMLRSLPEPEKVARLLADALASEVGGQVAAPAPVGARQPAQPSGARAGGLATAGG